MKINQKELKYLLYELSVQSPEFKVGYLPQFHLHFTKKQAFTFREDFSGSAKIACEWVKLSRKHQARGLDLDPEILQYANTHNVQKLSENEQKRIKLLKQNVLKPTLVKFDMIGAYNFSYYIFHERKTLLKYFKSAYQSLNHKGTFFLEAMGGEGFLKTALDKKTVYVPKNLNLPFKKFIQYWEQHQYDPISETCDYSIHFKFEDGTFINDAFTYHWRIWSIRTLRELLLEAGFKRTAVLWPTNDGSNEFIISENALSMKSWVSYVVGIKN